MTKKISLGITICLLVLAVAASSIITVFVMLNRYDSLLVDLPARAQQYDKLSDIDELVRNEFYGEIDSDIINSGLVSGFINGLNDPYSYYISAENIKPYTDYLEGKFYGTGINSYYDSESGYLIISFIDPFSPAFESSLKEGYYITCVGGKDVTAENSSKLIQTLTEGFDKKITVSYLESADSENSSDIELSCGYRSPSCEYKINNDVGYVHFVSFYEDTINEFLDAVEHFKTNNISALIIDIRNCIGTDYTSAAKIIDAIVPLASEGSGAIFTAKNADGEIISTYSSDSSALNMSIVVLMNSRTECAAELLACDLKDFGKAVLVGEKTSGRGTMQKMFELEDGGAVMLTVAEIFPYISDSFDGVGISPDMEVITSEAFKNKLDFSDFSEDEQYKTAYSYLTGQK